MGSEMIEKKPFNNQKHPGHRLGVFRNDQPKKE